MRPLQNITVVTLEHAIAAPLCTRHLADLGARVIKVERPDGGDFARDYDKRMRGLSSHFVWVNRSKESLTLDLKQERALKILKQLLAGADVFVQNLGPGATARLGLDYTTLNETHPKLLVCDISGYGDSGPYTRKRAYDLLIQSEAGFLSITGSPEQPAKAGLSIADIAAGMYAYSSILAALLERHRTGRGSHLAISMLEAMSEWMSYPLYYSIDGQSPPARTGASHASIFPYGPFVCGDGKTVMLGLQNEREWRTFCIKVLQRQDLASDPQYAGNANRLQHREKLQGIIDETFAALTSPQLIERLEQAQIANAQMNDLKCLWDHPQLKARNRWVTINTPAGPVPSLLPPHSVAGESDPPRMDAVPALGEHTDAILKGIGLSDAEIADLRTAHAV
jgi:crotonobetainyl-CoA:carnitine CoA-transferase CaiB-like acyl-CoA transferase